MDMKPQQADPDYANEGTEPPDNEGQEMQGGEGQAASPEEQKMYDWLVTEALDMVTGQDKAAMILQKIKGAEDPNVGIGQTAANIMKSVADGAKQQFQMEIDPWMLYQAGEEVVDHLMDIAQAANLIPDDPKNEEETVKVAMTTAVDTFKQMEGGQMEGGQSQAQPMQPQPNQPRGIVSSAMGA
jgi:hypothetical protein